MTAYELLTTLEMFADRGLINEKTPLLIVDDCEEAIDVKDVEVWGGQIILTAGKPAEELKPYTLGDLVEQMLNAAEDEDLTR